MSISGGTLDRASLVEETVAGFRNVACSAVHCKFWQSVIDPFLGSQARVEPYY